MFLSTTAGSITLTMEAYYYQPASTGYVVVEPPLGAIVPTLPPGSTATTVNGQTYFVYNNTYYKPVLVNGATGYQVVRL